MRVFTNMIFLYLILIILTVNSEKFDDYKIMYKVKIINDNFKILVNDCLFTSVPLNYQIPKEETDIQFDNIDIIEDSSLCSGPIKSARNASAVLTTRTDLCGIVQQIRNARASNMKIIIFTMTKKVFLPYLEGEFSKFPIVVSLPWHLFSKVPRADFNNARIGIYGAMGDNRIGITITSVIIFFIITLSLMLIVMSSIFFHKEHFIHMESMGSVEMKHMKWVVMIIPLMMVGSLLLLYFFYNVFVWMFIGFFVLATSLSVMNLAMLFFHKFAWCTHLVLPLNKYGIDNVDFRALGLFALGLIPAIVWVINRNNLAGIVLNNILGVLLCTEITVGLGVMFLVSKNFKALLALLTATLLIDAFMVYVPVGSSKLDTFQQAHAYSVNDSQFVRVKRAAGESLMEKVVTGTAGSSSEEVPIRFKVPVVDLNSGLSSFACMGGLKSYSMVGFGDIILPGIFIVYIVMFAIMTGHGAALYSVFTLFAYLSGLVITQIVVHYTERGQPALVFLLPSTVLPTLLLTVIKRDFMSLWHHSWPVIPPQTLQNLDDEAMLSVSIDEKAKVSL